MFSINQIFNDYYIYFRKLKDNFNRTTLKNYSRFHKLKKEFYTKLWTDTCQELNAEIHDYGHGFYKIKFGEASTYVHNNMVMLDNPLTLKMAGNKPLINKILAENNYPISKYFEYDIHTLKEAYNFLKSINQPGVVKPAQTGSAGSGITTGINSWNILKWASIEASIYHHKLLLEEQVGGNSYRLLYLNGRYLDALRRNPPTITGDSRQSIKKLIADETIRRMNGNEIISLHPLTIDLELKIYLNSKGYKLNEVLPKTRTIPVKRVINQNSCYENESVKNIAHPSIIKMGAQITKLLQVQLAGLDIICHDITKPLDRENGIINEVNTTPGLHHHYLISNRADVTHVALHILKYLLHLDEKHHVQPRKVFIGMEKITRLHCTKF